MVSRVRRHRRIAHLCTGQRSRPTNMSGARPRRAPRPNVTGKSLRVRTAGAAFLLSSIVSTRRSPALGRHLQLGGSVSIRDVAARDEDSALWTLEEIGRLVSESGNASETLTNIVHLIQRRFETDVCSVYLLEPDRANLVLAATIGLRAESVGRVRMRLTEGLAGLVAEQLRPQFVADADARIRASSTFREAGEDPYRSFLGVPDRRSRPAAGRARRPDDRAADLRRRRRAHAGDGRRRSWRRSSARRARSASSSRPAHQRLCALAQNLWWSWDPDTTSLFRELDPVLWRELDNNPIALLQQIPDRQARGARVAARAAQPHQLRLSPAAGVPALEAHLGRAPRRRALGPAGRLLLGRVRPARVAADLLGRPRHPRRRSHQERVGSRHPARRRRAVLRPGLLPAAARSRRLAARGLHRRRSPAAADPAGAQPTARRSTIAIETRTGTIAARVWQLSVGRNTLLLLDSNVDGNQPEDRELTARLYGGDDRVRIRQELLLGVGGVRALAALGIAPGVAAPERRTQRVRRARARPPAHGGRRHRRLGGDAPRLGAGRLHHAHAGAGRPRPLHAGARSRSTSGRCANRSGVDRERFMGLGRVNPSDGNETFCMTVLALKLVPPRQRRLVAARPGVARDVERRSIPIAARIACRSATSPTACTCRPGSRRRCARSTTATSAPTGRSARATPALWERIDDIDDGELWETHQTLKVQLIETVRRRAAQQAERRGEPPELVAQLRRALSLDALTIGFARRFATYKRANLMLQRHRGDRRARQQPDRCRSSSSSPASRIRTTARARRCCSRSRSSTRDPRFAGKLVFVEDYDINVGRHLVQGVDVWLNNPAPAARGLRHERPEGRAERRPEPVDPRRLVGGGLRRAERLRHRHGRDAHVDRRARRARRRVAARRAARRRHPALLRPRPRRPAARVDRAR